MKIKLAGSWICWLLKRHTWRRLRTRELHGTFPERICDRCGVRRTVKRRKEKPSAPSADLKVTP